MAPPTDDPASQSALERPTGTNAAPPPDSTDLAPLGRTRAARQRKAEKWQAMCIKTAVKRMPGWLVTTPVPIAVRSIGRRLGEAHCPDGPIFLAPRHVKSARPTQVRDTIMHELIHLQVAREGVREPRHGPRFQTLAAFFNLKDWGDNTWRYKHTCKTCGFWTKTHSKTIRSCPNRCGRMTRRDNVKLTRAQRADLAGRPIPPTPAKLPPDPLQVKLDQARANLKRAQTRLKRAKTLHDKWQRRTQYYERKVNRPHIEPAAPA